MEMWNQLADFFKHLCRCKNNRVDNHVEGGGQFIPHGSKNSNIVEHGSKKGNFQKLPNCYIPVKPTSLVIKVNENQIQTILQDIDKEDKSIVSESKEDPINNNYDDNISNINNKTHANDNVVFNSNINNIRNNDQNTRAISKTTLGNILHSFDRNDNIDKFNTNINDPKNSHARINKNHQILDIRDLTKQLCLCGQHFEDNSPSNKTVHRLCECINGKHITIYNTLIVDKIIRDVFIPYKTKEKHLFVTSDNFTKNKALNLTYNRSNRYGFQPKNTVFQVKSHEFWECKGHDFNSNFYEIFWISKMPVQTVQCVNSEPRCVGKRHAIFEDYGKHFPGYVYKTVIFKDPKWQTSLSN